MNIRTMIENYTPYNEQEKKDKEVFLQYIDQFNNILTRENEFAHLTSSAFVINKERTKALMVYHNIYDSWIWPGGHADGEKDLLGVALREVTEETGIKNLTPISVDIFSLDTWPVLGHYKKGKYVPAHTHLSIGYLIEAGENELLIVKEDENSKVQWILIDGLIQNVKEAYIKSTFQKIISKIESCKK